MGDRFAGMPSWYRDPTAPEPNVPRKIGVTALIERDGSFLVEQRVDDPDVWAFIGGTVEDDEQLLDALAREVLEETGFAIEHARLLGLFSDPTRIGAYPDGTVCRILSVAFRVTPRGDRRADGERRVGGHAVRRARGTRITPFLACTEAHPGGPARRGRGNRGRLTEISGTTRLVGIIGWPVEHSLSPQMQNAAFRELGLDWTYVALPTRPEQLEEAVRGLAALGFAGANVTAPHKLAAAELCETDAPSVNTLVVRDGRIEGHSTDTAILAALAAERPVVIGDGGSATAFMEALPHARQFSRRAAWPPEVGDADLVVNATSERDDVLAELDAGQTLVDLPYPETATARRSARRQAPA